MKNLLDWHIASELRNNDSEFQRISKSKDTDILIELAKNVNCNELTFYTLVNKNISCVDWHLAYNESLPKNLRKVIERRKQYLRFCNYKNIKYETI